MEIYAYAKINFFLDITGKRKDGYHNIVSVMQTIDWYDTVNIVKNGTNETVLHIDNAALPTDRRNTAYLAAMKYLERASVMDGVTIHIQKRIPVAAGMAGGSADAAAVLRGMNELFSGRLTVDELMELGTGIGADVPFCINGGTKRVSGIGDILEPCPDFPDCIILCAKTGNGVSTPCAYRLLDEKYNDFAKHCPNRDRYDRLIEGIKANNALMASDGFFNLFESVIPARDSSVEMLRRVCLNNGAYAAMMSGSGPSVFGLFHSDTEAGKALEYLLANGISAKICHPVRQFKV